MEMCTKNKSSWLGRPAITFVGTNTESSSDSCYWPEKILTSLCQEEPWDFCVSNSHNETSCDGQSEQLRISYGSLIRACIPIVKSLRDALTNELASLMTSPNPVSDWPVGIPIAVAIPEGPLLPLAIMAVHVLNDPRCFPSVGGKAHYAVLVPIEPSEGEDRLRHMLHDARPSLILCMEHDIQRLEYLVTRNPKDAALALDGLNEESSCLSYSLFRVERVPKFIDVAKLFEKALSSDSNSLTASLMKRALGNTAQGAAALITDYALWSETSSSAKETTCEHIDNNRVSHIVYTSGTTGIPKGCVSSIAALRHYLKSKNEAHGVQESSVVMLASALSFDPCLSDILATFMAGSTLAMAPRAQLYQDLPVILSKLQVTHVLCTPTLWGTMQRNITPTSIQSLQVVALGGEPIPRRIIDTWARKEHDNGLLRLMATYGVTEACVYQTCGEVFADSSNANATAQDGRPAHNIGTPLSGNAFRICKEEADGLKSTDARPLQDVPDSQLGEVVLHGDQVDELSSYLNHEDLTRKSFVHVEGTPSRNVYYRTGDRGYRDPITKKLHLVGRINGQDGMVKINGVRVELGEIDAAINDNEFDSSDSFMYPQVVTSCLTSVMDDDEQKKIIAYCVLSDACRTELGLSIGTHTGVICVPGILLELLRSRTERRVRAGCLPSAFVIIPQIPISPTGKCDRRLLPSLRNCVPLDTVQGLATQNLGDYGGAGPAVSSCITECLNIHQRSIVTTRATFAVLGGDSLSATRVVRALYAHHHGVQNNRFIGGEYGSLEGPFTAVHLLAAKNLGEYVDWLDSNGVCQEKGIVPGRETCNENSNNPQHITDRQLSRHGVTSNSTESRLHDSLIEAISKKCSSIAVGLLDLGIDPNYGAHGGRLGKSGDRNERKKTFVSSPMHIACSAGDHIVVRKLLQKGSKFNSPDAQGSFPIHLACSQTSSKSSDDTDGEEDRRLVCVRLLLEAGAPFYMKDGNKQTVLHCSARAGRSRLVDFLMKKWLTTEDAKSESIAKKHVNKKSFFDWQDRWFRTPVHWAVLNGNVDTLRVLLENGCHPAPTKPKARHSDRRTSVAVETPLEICSRLYDCSKGPGLALKELLTCS